MSKILEIIKGLEIAKLKGVDVKGIMERYSEDAASISKTIRISLNFLPNRSEALTQLTEDSSAMKTWKHELEYIISKIDTAIRELKLEIGINPMTPMEFAEPRDIEFSDIQATEAIEGGKKPADNSATKHKRAGATKN